MKRLALEILILALLSLTLAFARQWAPRGIAWNGRWPTSATSAEDAYKMMAKAGDPGFVSMPEALDLQKKKSVVFLDARSKEEFDQGRIPGARHLPFYEMDKYQEEALEGVTTETMIVIYCEGIGCELSFFLGRELQTAGLTNIKIFYGGYPEWQAAGLPIEK